VSLRVDSSKHIYIAATALHAGNVTIGINAANIDCKRLSGDINFVFTDGSFGVDANLNSIDNASIFAKTGFFVGGEII
jgi:hypothetical protein